jgi:hypothetical protein
VNSHDAAAAAVGEEAAARASPVNSATAAIADSTPTIAGPSVAASGANSSEYPSTWCPPYHCAFQTVRPSCSNSHAR